MWAAWTLALMSSQGKGGDPGGWELGGALAGRRLSPCLVHPQMQKPME